MVSSGTTTEQEKQKEEQARREEEERKREKYKNEMEAYYEGRGWAPAPWISLADIEKEKQQAPTDFEIQTAIICQERIDNLPVLNSGPYQDKKTKEIVTYDADKNTIRLGKDFGNSIDLAMELLKAQGFGSAKMIAETSAFIDKHMLLQFIQKAEEKGLAVDLKDPNVQKALLEMDEKERKEILARQDEVNARAKVIQLDRKQRRRGELGRQETVLKDLAKDSIEEKYKDKNKPNKTLSDKTVEYKAATFGESNKLTNPVEKDKKRVEEINKEYEIVSKALNQFKQTTEVPKKYLNDVLASARNPNTDISMLEEVHRKGEPLRKNLYEGIDKQRTDLSLRAKILEEEAKQIIGRQMPSNTDNPNKKDAESALEKIQKLTTDIQAINTDELKQQDENLLKQTLQKAQTYHDVMRQTK